MGMVEEATRLIPAGALTGLQFLKTPDCIQIVGFIDQTKVNIANGDYGGEMDPHGADLVRSFRLLFILTLSSTLFSTETLWEVLCIQQTSLGLIHKLWNGVSLPFLFPPFLLPLTLISSTSVIGGNAFYLKACDPAGPNVANYCQHIYGRIVCAYNAPNQCDT
jgi:hypothetical protein